MLPKGRPKSSISVTTLAERLRSSLALKLVRIADRIKEPNGIWTAS